jgi:catechol 2,3-dioxygenase-like lactoylglutathione lyase family enzyme
MHIEHLALWTTDLERSKKFYVEYFEAIASPHYVNASKGFESFFLSFDGGARIEVKRTTSHKPMEIPRGAQRTAIESHPSQQGRPEMTADKRQAVDEPTQTCGGLPPWPF